MAEKIFEDQRKAYKNRADSINKQQGEAFLAENKTKDGVVTLPSGLQYKVLKKGEGAVPKLNDKVQVVYEGKTIHGKVFDATSKHGGVEFDTFTPANLIKGWQEALTMMPVGSKWQLYIPYDLAYGPQGAGRDIAPYSTLIFTMELKGIEPEKKELDQGAPAAGKQNAKSVQLLQRLNRALSRSRQQPRSVKASAMFQNRWKEKNFRKYSFLKQTKCAFVAHFLFLFVGSYAENEYFCSLNAQL